MSTFSRPMTLTGTIAVFKMSHDHARASACCMHPVRSNSDAIMENAPSTMV